VEHLGPPAPPSLKEIGLGQPVLLVHDLGFDSRQWSPQIAPFGRRYTGLRVEWNYTRICPNGSWSEQFMSLRGTAFVGIVPEMRHVDPADDLLALMDRHEVASAHLVVSGDTFGNPMIELAVEHPARVRSLTITSWTSETFVREAFADSDYSRGQIAQIEEYEELVAHGDVDRFVDYLVESGSYRMNEDFARYIAREMLVDNMSTFSPPMVQVTNPRIPVHERLAEVGQPTLALIGRQVRPWQRAASDYLARHVPDGRLAVVPEAGRYPNLDNPKAFNAEVLSFLADVDARTAR